MRGVQLSQWAIVHVAADMHHGSSVLPYLDPDRREGMQQIMNEF